MTSKFKRFNTQQIMGILLMVFLLVSCGYHYIEYQVQVEKNIASRQNIQRDYDEIRWETIQSIIGVLNREGAIYSKLVAHVLRHDIEDSYPNMQKLREKFDKNQYSDTKFTSIILNSVSNNSFLGHPSNRNGILIACDDKILYNLMIPSKTFDTEVDEFIKNHYNPQLAANTMKSIFSRNSDFNILEPSKPYHVLSGNEHKQIVASSMEEVKSVFLKEGLVGLSGYVMVSPYYVTETGDIFDVPDFDITGMKTNNHKIIVMSYVSIYDIIKSYHNNRLSVLDRLETEAIMKNKMELTQLYYSSIKSMLLHLFFIVAVLLLSKHIHEKA